MIRDAARRIRGRPPGAARRAPRSRARGGRSFSPTSRSSPRTASWRSTSRPNTAARKPAPSPSRWRSRNSGYACASTAVASSVTNMVGEVIQAVGSPEQKERHLPRLADGTYPAGAFCLTESGAGSDPSGHADARAPRRRRLRHRRREDSTSPAPNSPALFVVWAVTDPEAPKGKGISCFLVERGTPGLVDRQGREEDGPDRLADERRAFRRLPRPRRRR